MSPFKFLYTSLLHRAPRAFRDRYGLEMAAMAAERVSEQRGAARLTKALSELADLSVTVRRERRRARDGRSTTRWTGWRADAATVAAGLRRRPAAATAITLLLAIGLGAGTLGYSVMSSVLLRPLPYGHPDALVMIWGFVPRIQAGLPEVPIHGLRVLQYRESIGSTSAIEGFKADVFNLDVAGAPSERLDGLLTTASLFDTLQVRPALGRFFLATEDQPNAPCAAVIGHGLWLRRFGGDVRVAGHVVRLNDRACTIVGVAPRGFDFPRGGEMPATFQYPGRTELWVASPPPNRGPSDLTVLARLKPGVAAGSAQAELDAFADQTDRQVPSSKGWNGVKVVPLTRQVVPPAIVLTVRVLFGAMAILLLAAAGNAAQLLVVRGLARRTDLAVRAALGASPWRLVRTAWLEAAFVTAAAAGLGAAFAEIGVRLIRALGPDRFPRLSETALDWRALTFLTVAAAVTSLITAVGPVLLARRASAESTLHGRPRGTSDHLRPIRRGLIGAQVTFAVLLLTGSGLLLRSFQARLAVDPGFRAHHALAFEVTLPAASYPEVLRGPVPASRPAIIAAVDALLARVRAIPGVESAALGKPLPMSGAQEASGFAAEGLPPASSAQVPVAEYIVVSDDFFRAIGTPILSGREFTAGDREASEPAVVVNETMAKQLWPNESALGHRVKLGGSKSPAPWLTIVGIAKDMKRYGLDDHASAAMYVSYTQGPYPSLATLPFVVRTAMDDPMAVLPAIRAAAVESGLRVPVAAPETLAALVARVSADARFAMWLMVSLAAAALALTIAGLYGTVAFAVSQRTHELGIRAALGAVPRQLIRLVLDDGVQPALVGALAGLAGALAVTRLLSGMLFGISPIDPLTFTSVPVLLACTVVAACLIPARRAADVDPRDTLRGA